MWSTSGFNSKTSWLLTFFLYASPQSHYTHTLLQRYTFSFTYITVMFTYLCWCCSCATCHIESNRKLESNLLFMYTYLARFWFWFISNPSDLSCLVTMSSRCERLDVFLQLNSKEQKYESCHWPRKPAYKDQVISWCHCWQHQLCRKKKLEYHMNKLVTTCLNHLRNTVSIQPVWTLKDKIYLYQSHSGEISDVEVVASWLYDFTNDF